MSQRLDKVANLAIIGFVIFAGSLLAWRHLAPAPKPLTEADRIQPGEILEGLPAATGRTLYLALQPDCRFCTESLPFYRELVERRDRQGGALRIVALVGRVAEVEAERAVLEQAGIAVDAIEEASFERLRILGTPTLLLASDDRLDALWQGKPADRAAEEEILRGLGLDGLCDQGCDG